MLVACGLFLFSFLSGAAGLRAGSILIIGDALGKSEVFADRLRSAGFTPRVVNASALEELDASRDALLLVASDVALPPESRLWISRYLAAGGHVVVVGPRAFDYTPSPVRGVALGRLDDARAYQIVYPQRKRVSTTPSVAETERMTVVDGPDGRPALSFRTYLRGMRDFMVEFDASGVRSRDRSVLQFWAKGDAFMDLIAIEIVDAEDRRWFGFVPLRAEWTHHAISLADFIPEGWSDPDAPCPLLDPEAVTSIALGTNMLTVWTEKPMTLELGTVKLAENANGVYAPTSAVRYVRLPFRENDITTPSWLFDPFARTRSVEAVHGLRASEHAPAGTAKTISGPLTTWLCPTPYLEHPGTRMGTDHKKDYILKFERERRHVGFWDVIDEHGHPIGAVAELQVAVAGPWRGAGIGLFGVDVATLVSTPALQDSLADLVLYAAGRPKVAGATINTTDASQGGVARPAVEVTVQNPLAEPVRGRLTVNVGGDRIRGAAEIEIPRRGTARQTVTLSEVPEDFPFEQFDWEVRLETDAGADTLHDRVDLERGLLHALTHMVNIQREFPDGRYGHHYFGDAYGVRALFAYLDLLKRQPERLERNRDLWSRVSPRELRESGLRFFDMLVERQNEDGSIPMGYGEHHNVYNVADGGQITISFGQILPLLHDAGRMERYLQLCRSFHYWAETFYIDEALSAELSARFPRRAEKSETRAGNYGLGWGFLTRNQTGPKWVLADILGIQALITYLDPNPDYRRILERNVRAYLDAGYDASGYFWAEGLVWCWLTIEDETIRRRIAQLLRDTFLPELVAGKANDMFDRGARETLNALPLAYYRRWFEDNAGLRAVQLKYAWAFASENAAHSMRRIAMAAPKPGHGESIAAAKFAAFSAIWAIELLDPGSSLLRVEGFPRAPVPFR